MAVRSGYENWVDVNNASGASIPWWIGIILNDVYNIRTIMAIEAYHGYTWTEGMRVGGNTYNTAN